MSILSTHSTNKSTMIGLVTILVIIAIVILFGIQMRTDTSVAVDDDTIGAYEPTTGDLLREITLLQNRYDKLESQTKHLSLTTDRLVEADKMTGDILKEIITLIKEIAVDVEKLKENP